MLSLPCWVTDTLGVFVSAVGLLQGLKLLIFPVGLLVWLAGASFPSWCLHRGPEQGKELQRKGAGAVRFYSRPYELNHAQWWQEI